MLSLLGTGYFLKIAKINCQREKPTCPRRKNQFPRKRKKSPIRKNKLPQKFRAIRYTHLQCSLFCIGHLLSLSCIYSLSSNSLKRSVSWGGVRDESAGLAGLLLLLLFKRYQLSVLVTFSFSYNTRIAYLITMEVAISKP